MANTSYQELFDLFMQQVEDYRLLELYNGGVGESNLTTYLIGFMNLAIPEFEPCTQNLQDKDDGAKTFNFEMTMENKKLLSKFMVKEWLGKELKDILQMRWNITDQGSFKHFSEAQNTKSKSEVFEQLREDCSQALMSYSLKHNDWDAWSIGKFI